MSGSVRIPTANEMKRKIRNSQSNNEEGSSCPNPLSPLVAFSKAFQKKFIGNIERFFQWYGELAARHPFITIFCSLLLFLLCASGVAKLENEDDGLKLWLPIGTDFKRRSEYLDTVFEDEGRHNRIIVIAKEGNILTAQNLKAIYKLREGIAAIRTKNGATWENRCDRAHRSEGNDEEEANEGSFTFPTAVFPEEVCRNIEKEEREQGNMLKFCKENHLFEIWANEGLFDESTKNAIESLTDADVLAAINADEVISGLTGSELYPRTVLGTVKKENGNIVSAKAMSFGFEEIDTEEDESLEHDMTMDFEQALIDLVNDFEFDAPGLIAFPNAFRSRNDISGSDSDSDLQLFFVGYALVGIYVQLMLGKFNKLETRYAISIAGIVAVGFGLISSYGVCSYIGWFSSNMNQIMPFLILGIGIDDMFVIAQNFDNLEASDLPLNKKMGVGLRHAGMAITITTLTDILAFGVGASTALPALRNFCLYCAFAIFFVYVYMLTFFFALFVLDQRRVEAKRSAFFCCNKLPDDYQPNACSQKPLLPRFFRAYANFLINKYVKIVILILTTILLGMSIYGVSKLEANFDQNMFVPEGNYLRDFIEHRDEYFPSGGMVGAIYMANVPDMHTKMHIVKKMRLELEGMDILADSSGKGGFDDEFEDYIDFTQPSANYPESALDKTTFYENVAEFLWTVGKPHQEMVRFQRELVCEKSTGDFSMLSVPYRHLGYADANEEIDRMHDMEDFADKYLEELGVKERPEKDGDPDVFAMSPSYANNAFMEILVQELYRNILLAMVCVFATAMLLIANLTASVIVVSCVFITIIDVGGFMYFWGLDIETIAAILLTIALGLAVDYSAHIAHTFMVSSGTRDERVYESLAGMGPAVLNGGFSTFLAFAILAASKSIVFKIFFKIFFLVVSFGLYHGLVFLPVILSFIGPPTSSSLDAGDHPSKVEPKVDDDDKDKDVEIATITNGSNFSSPVNGTEMTTTHSGNEPVSGVYTNGTNGTANVVPAPVTD